MNRLIFEGRFLVNMTATIIGQNDLRILHRRLNWERMYRVADYHKIANLIYLGILGNGESVPERWRDHFFERYQQAMRFGEGCAEGEQEVLSLLDMMQIPCIILDSSAIRAYYNIPEAAGNSPLRVYLAMEAYTRVKGFLVDLGYETEQSYKGYGERMRKSSGFSVEIYDRLPFRTRLYEKNMVRILECSSIKNTYEYIRVLSLEDRFIYRMAQAAYRYVTDELIIREVLDLFLYHRKWQKQMNEEYISRILMDMRIDELSEKLLHLSYIWFGTAEERKLNDVYLYDTTEVYDILENRILSRGEINKENDQQALLLMKLIERDIAKENRIQRWETIKKNIRTKYTAMMKKVRWAFPEYKYMCAIYPVLEKAPILLPGCWIRRLFRFGLEHIRRRN